MIELMTKVVNLSLKEKEGLKLELERLIQEEREKEVENISFTEIRDKVCSILGLLIFNPDSRERIQFTARVLIANYLMQRGYSETRVGLILGKDHSTIHHCKDVLNTWIEYPMFYPEEHHYWKQLQKQI